MTYGAACAISMRWVISIRLGGNHRRVLEATRWTVSEQIQDTAAD